MTAVESWPEFWGRAVENCIASGQPIPDEDTLRAEYIERTKQLAGLEAWAETQEAS